MNKLQGVAVVVGAMGMLTLGACSSGSNEAAPTREAGPVQSPTPVEPSAMVTMPALQSGPYKDVVVTHDSTAAECATPHEDGGNLIVNCNHVGVTIVGDPVFIGVPNDKYRISVARMGGVDEPLVTIQRNLAYIKVKESKDEHTVWNSPYKVKAQMDKFWGVGMSGVWTLDRSTSATSFWAVVTKIK